jgi:hypothetical protein
MPLLYLVRRSSATQATVRAECSRVSRSPSCCLSSRPGLSAVLCVARVGEAGLGEYSGMTPER